MLTHITIFVCLAVLSSVYASPSFKFKYDPTSKGVEGKGIDLWSFDVKDQGQTLPVATSVKNAGGPSAFDSIRVAWYPEYGLVNDTLHPLAISNMSLEVSLANQVYDRLPFFLSPELGDMSSYYLDSDGEVDPSLWVKGMEAARDYYINHFGKEIKYNGPTNEPDNTGGKFTADIFVKIRELLSVSGWGQTRQVGPCSETPITAISWLPTIATGTHLLAATTHADGTASVADMLSAYKAFYTLANKLNFDQVWNSECHQLAEALVAAELGFSHLVWWGYISETRGKFMQLAIDTNSRLFYREFGPWGAVASYLDPAEEEEGGQYIFIGNKDPDNNYTLEFVSTTVPVYFDGNGPMYNYSINVPADGELFIHVTLNATSLT